MRRNIPSNAPPNTTANAIELMAMEFKVMYAERNTFLRALSRATESNEAFLPPVISRAGKGKTNPVTKWGSWVLPSQDRKSMNFKQDE